MCDVILNGVVNYRFIIIKNIVLPFSLFHYFTCPHFILLSPIVSLSHSLSPSFSHHFLVPCDEKWLKEETIFHIDDLIPEWNMCIISFKGRQLRSNSPFYLSCQVHVFDSVVNDRFLSIFPPLFCCSLGNDVLSGSCSTRLSSGGCNWAFLWH